MKDLADRLKICVIEGCAQELEKVVSVIKLYAIELEGSPPDLEQDTFESLETSFMIIGKILTDHLERNEHEKERSLSG